MKRIVTQAAALLGAATIALAAGGAFAADLPSRKSAPAPIFMPPAFTWTGFYAGLNAGYAFEGSNDVTTSGTPGFLALIPGGIAPNSLKAGGDGFIGGAQIGYNIQFGQLVYGLETDIQFADTKKKSSFIGNPVLGTQLLTSAEAEMRYFGTLRARLGFTPVDRLLVYATGGLAYGDVKTTLAVNGVQNGNLGWAGSKSDIRFGWTVGAGVEYALTNNWSIKGEYLYYDLGKKNITTIANAAANAAVPGVAYVGKAETTGHIARAGVNYKF